MKKIALLIALLTAAGPIDGRAQDTWTQKTDFGGGTRTNAVGFGLRGKSYIGTGSQSGVGATKDLWEYDTSANTWTQKADFGGTARHTAVGFAINGKGYIGTGTVTITSSFKDFWEYDPVTNTWTQKADFGGGDRWRAVGFSIGRKGYVGTGRVTNAFDVMADFWEYDPAANIWMRKADFGGGTREFAVGFSIGDLGYLGIGSSGPFRADFWEYNPSANSWTQKSDYPGSGGQGAIGFGLGGKGYVGTGNGAGNGSKDFWEYDPATNTWTQKADVGGNGRVYGVGFSINSKGYAGLGYPGFGSGFSDFWEYSPDGSSSTCDVPGSLTTSNITDTSATLSWGAVSGAVAYDVSYKVVGAPRWTVIRSTGNMTTLEGLMPGTSYLWRVRTICSLSVKSGYSPQVQFTTTSGGGCEIPTGLFSEATATTAFLQWDTAAGAISYEIMYRVVTDTTWATVQATPSRLRLTGLTPRTRYVWKVKSICSDSSSEYSPEETFKTFPF